MIYNIRRPLQASSVLEYGEPVKRFPSTDIQSNIHLPNPINPTTLNSCPSSQPSSQAACQACNLQPAGFQPPILQESMIAIFQ